MVLFALVRVVWAALLVGVMLQHGHMPAGSVALVNRELDPHRGQRVLPGEVYTGGGSSFFFEMLSKKRVKSSYSAQLLFFFTMVNNIQL